VFFFFFFFFLYGNYMFIQFSYVTVQLLCSLDLSFVGIFFVVLKGEVTL